MIVMISAIEQAYVQINKVLVTYEVIPQNM